MARKLDIDSANALLSRVRIIIRGNKLYLRATLPGKLGFHRKQYDVSTGLNHNPDGIKIALLRAQKIESDLNLGLFKWSDWIDILPDNQIRVKEAIAAYEKFYWDVNPCTLSRKRGYENRYSRYFDSLPDQEPLTGALLRDALIKYPPNSASRSHAYIAYSAIARWHGVELPKDWKYLKGKYKPSEDRIIPTDKEIEEIRDGINNDGWRWVFGVLAAYGLRPHEVYRLDISRFPVMRVSGDAKTGARLVYPLPAHWAYEWALQNKILPCIDFENLTNQRAGAKVSQKFSRLQLGIIPYSLRDAYAIRGARLGIDSLIMSRWMGHSVEVHSSSYLRFIDEAAQEKIWQESGGGSLRVLPEITGLEDFG